MKVHIFHRLEINPYNKFLHEFQNYELGWEWAYSLEIISPIRVPQFGSCWLQLPPSAFY